MIFVDMFFWVVFGNVGDVWYGIVKRLWVSKLFVVMIFNYVLGEIWMLFNWCCGYCVVVVVVVICLSIVVCVEYVIVDLEE